jgi:hypothetical protein
LLNDAAGGASGAGGLGGGGGGGFPGSGGVGGAAGNPCAGASVDAVVTVARPAMNPDGESPVTQETWDACATSANCLALCEDVVPHSNLINVIVSTCEPVAPGDAGLDAGRGGSSAIDGDTGAPTLDLHIVYGPNCTGRRPAALAPVRRATCGSSVGRWLADVATLEAASVPAFRRLATELAAHRAPVRLINAARQAARDEIRHYALAARAARARGALPRLPRVKWMPVRSLVEVAAENVREGCVRETFGAVTAAYQSRHAADPGVRSMMNVIAVDEARHARLAWEIDAWVSSALSTRVVRRLSEDRFAAGESIEGEIIAATSTEPSLATPLGLPTYPVVRELAGNARRLLWSEG